MNERRSGRARKQVDYTKFEADNDDDFADPTPPQPKRQKKGETAAKEKVRTKKIVVESPEKPSSRKKRMAPGEKLYERELQAALEMSLLEGPPLEDCDSADKHTFAHSTPLLSSHCKTDLPGESQSIMPSAIPGSTAVDNDIEFLGTSTCEDCSPPPVLRRVREFLGTSTCEDSNLPPVLRCVTSGKRKTRVVEDEEEEDSSDSEDFSDAAESSASDSDFEDADSDFDNSKIKTKPKTKMKAALARSKAAATVEKKSQSLKREKGEAEPVKSAPLPQTSTNAAAERKPSNSVKPSAPEKPSSPVKTSAPEKPSSPVKPSASEKQHVPVKPDAPAKTAKVTVKPAAEFTPTPVRGQASTVPHKPPAWSPPGRVGTHDSGSGSSSASTSLKSPSSGLRLGLSRHARIKPLHPSLKVS